MLQAVEVAIRLLQMTAAAGHFLQENHLYKSFRLLQRVKEGLLAIREEEGPQGRSAAARPLQPPAADGQSMPEQWKFPSLLFPQRSRPSSCASRAASQERRMPQ